MTEALLLVITGSLLAIGVVTLVISALILRDARRSVELAEECMRYVREERSRLRVFTREEHAETQLSEELEYERERRKQERREAERRISDLERDIQEARREGSPPVAAGLSEGLMETGKLSEEKPLPTRKAPQRRQRPESFPETTSSWEPVEGAQRGKRTRRGVWMPHPDDNVDHVKAERAQAQNNAPVEMFRKHYDKYLENYKGYVEMSEKLHQMRNGGEVPPGSPAEREWEKRMRRVNDGIDRTATRLDILEEHNPELATDDRVSRRASLARRYSKLGRSE